MSEKITTKALLHQAYVKALKDYFAIGALYKVKTSRIGWADIEAVQSQINEKILYFSSGDIVLIIGEPTIFNIPEYFSFAHTQSVSRSWILLKAHSLKHQRNFIFVWSMLPDILYKKNLIKQFEKLEESDRV